MCGSIFAAAAGQTTARGHSPLPLTSCYLNLSFAAAAAACGALCRARAAAWPPLCAGKQRLQGDERRLRGCECDDVRFALQVLVMMMLSCDAVREVSDVRGVGGDV